MNRCDHAAPTAHVIDRVSCDAQIAELWSAIFENFNMEHYRCRNILRAAKRCPSLLVRSVFCGAGSVPFGYNHIFGHRHSKMCSSSDIAIAYFDKRN